MRAAGVLPRKKERGPLLHDRKNEEEVQVKRLFAPLVAGAIVASMLLGGAAIASASTARRPGQLNAGTMSRSYMNSAMLNYTHMSAADFAEARATGWSCWSIAASSGVAPGNVVKTAAGRAQSVVSGRVRHRWMSRRSAASFMRTFRADCWKYLGTAQTPPGASVPPTGTPGYGCGPWAPGVPTTTTPCVPTTGTWTPGVPPTSTPVVPPVADPGSGWGPGMCW